MERHNRSFSLTSAGEYLYRHAPDLLESAAQLEAATTIVGQRQISHLTVGYLREYAGIDIARAVSTFNQHFPKIQINLRQGNHEELYDLLNDEKVDLIFSDQRRALSDEYVIRKYDPTSSTNRMTKLGRTVGAVRTVLRPYLGTRFVVGEHVICEIV